MAAVIPFNYTNMQNAMGMQIGMDTNNKYAENLKQEGQNWGNAFSTVAGAISDNQTNNAIRGSTDDKGNVDSTALFQQLAQTDPQKALALKQQMDQQSLANAKTQSEIARNMAQQRAQEAVQTMNNMKVASGVLTQFNQQLANSTPETWDATVQQAKKLAAHYGLEDALPDNFSEGYSADKKQLAMNAALSYKDKLDQEQQDFKNQLDSGKYMLDSANTASQIADRTASREIQQQNADTSALNARTGVRNADTSEARAAADQQKAQQQALANKQKSYTQDVEKFTKAKSDFVEKRSQINTSINTLSNSLGALQQARQMLSNNPNLAGSMSAKGGVAISKIFGGNNQFSNFANLLNQGASSQVLQVMSTQKGSQTDKDAETIRNSVITDSATTDPKILLASLDSLINTMNRNIADKNKELSTGLSGLKQLQSSLTSKYGAGGGQDTSSSDASSSDAQ